MVSVCQLALSSLCPQKSVSLTTSASVDSAARPEHFCSACTEESFPSDMHPRDGVKIVKAQSQKAHKRVPILARAGRLELNQAGYCARNHCLILQACARSPFTHHRHRLFQGVQAKNLSVFLHTYAPTVLLH